MLCSVALRDLCCCAMSFCVVWCIVAWGGVGLGCVAWCGVVWLGVLLSSVF